MADNSGYIAQIQQAASDSGFTPALGALIVAQAQVESGNFTSNLFTQANNAFGYDFVGQDNATQSSLSHDGYYYAQYTSVYYSALEICNWIIRNIPNYNSISTPSDYAYALKHSKIGAYYGASTSSYAIGLAYYFSLPSVGAFVNNNPTTTIFLIGGISVGMSFYIYWIIKKKKI